MRIDSEQVRDAARHLALAAGLLTILLAPAFLLLQKPLAKIELGDYTVVAIDLVLGFVLIAAARLTEKNPLTSVVLGFVASLSLLALGGSAGLIGGLFGLASAVLGSIPLAQELLT